MYTIKDLREGNVPPVLKPKEVMKMLRMGRQTFYEYVRVGKIPHIKYGNRIFVPTKKLMEWLDKVC